jgi:hypothetical protein
MYTVKSIQPEDCSEAAIQSVAKWFQSKEGNKEEHERHRQREKYRSGDAECIQSKACSEAAPFSRWRHRHRKKRTESASIVFEEGEHEKEDGK